MTSEPSYDGELPIGKDWQKTGGKPRCTQPVAVTVEGAVISLLFVHSFHRRGKRYRPKQNLGLNGPFQEFLFRWFENGIQGEGKVILDTKKRYQRPLCVSENNGTYQDDLNPMPSYLSLTSMTSYHSKSIPVYCFQNDQNVILAEFQFQFSQIFVEAHVVFNSFLLYCQTKGERIYHLDIEWFVVKIKKIETMRMCIPTSCLQCCHLTQANNFKRAQVMDLASQEVERTLGIFIL